MSNVRQAVKTSVQTLLKNVSGVGSVDTVRRQIYDAQQFPNVTINLVKSDETRASASAPNGKKRIQFTVQLEIVGEDVSLDGSGQTNFDNLLDAIDSQLRTDPQLAGTVLASAVEFIRTTYAPPFAVNQQTFKLMAIKQFDVTVQVTG